MTEVIISSSVLIAVVIALRYVFKGKISRRVQYALWALVLLRLFMPFSLMGSPISVMNAVGTAQTAGAVPDVQTYPDGDGDTGASLDEVSPTGTQILNDTQSGPAQGGSGVAESGAFADLKDNLPQLLKTVWLAGAIAAGLWFLGTNLIFYGKLRKSRKVYVTHCPLPVYVTDGIASPCLFGLFHPAVYVTSKAFEGEESLNYVLAHELCHYRHGDHIWSALRGVCLAAYWFNPLVWAAAILSREDSELACDEAVIKRIGEDRRLDYGHTLLDMVAVRKTRTGIVCAATTMVSGKRGLKKRLNMIVKNPKTFLPALAAVLLVAAVCAGCTFTGAKNKLSAGEALDQLESSVTYADGQVSFEIPKDYETPEDWNIHIAGRLVSEDGFSQSRHLFEDINDAKTWEPGKRYDIALSDDYTELTLTAALPGEDGDTLEKDIDLLGGLYGRMARTLYDLRNPYIGDASADGALLEAVGVSNLGSYTIELETDSKPYILRVVFENRQDNVVGLDNGMNRVSYLLLALIDNASEIQWRYTCYEPDSDSIGEFTGSLSEADANAALNGDIKSYGQSAEKMTALFEWMKSGLTTAADTPAPNFPEVAMTFSTDSTGLRQIGQDAADFYYAQFMSDNVAQYWHITKHETKNCALEAGDENEFAVLVTSYVETDGLGFLVGRGIPYDIDDLSKGGICPDVTAEIRIKSLGGGDYEIVSVGTGGGAQGLAPIETPAGNVSTEQFAWDFINKEIENFASSGVTITDSKIEDMTLLECYYQMTDYPIEVWQLQYRLLPEDMSKVIFAGGMQQEDGWITESSSMGQPCLIVSYENGQPALMGITWTGNFAEEGSRENALRLWLEGNGILEAETYPGNHMFAGFTLSDGTAAELTLSQPVRQGDTGIWCVERWTEENGNLYLVAPNPNGLAMTYYEDLQTQCDNGHKPGELDPEQVALAYISNVLGQKAQLDYISDISNQSAPEESMASDT